MINFRFHLISLVAVFLALGVGVAMGASFVDRATVDSLRDRVDALDEGYRRRGDEVQALTSQLESSDAQAAALAGEGSAALAGQLADQPVVLLTTDGVPGDVLDATRTSLAAGGAVESGTIRLQPTLDLADEDVLRSTRERFDMRSRPVREVQRRVVADLGQALALLSGENAEEPGEGAGGLVPPDGTVAPPPALEPLEPTTTVDPSAPLERPTDVAGARAVLSALTELGLIAIDTGGVAPGESFPAVTGVQYVMVIGATDDAAGAEIAVPLAIEVARQAPAVLTVAEARPSRPDGVPTSTTEGEPPRGGVVDVLRSGTTEDRLSTVDDLEEAFGRIALVLAVAEHAQGRVGHYGIGQDATAPFPTVPAG